MQQESQTEQIVYIDYNDLQNPQPSSIQHSTIEEGLQSKEWRANFDTITCLRQANKYYSNLFLQELLPRTYRQIIQQIDNLRSNNSKQALNLASEIFQYQKLDALAQKILGPLIQAVFMKTVSQKGFLKRQALKAVNFLPKKYNICIVDEFSGLTQSPNGQICQLAIQLLSQYIEYNKIRQFDPSFYRTLSINLEGKRAILQKKAKQILQGIKSRIGAQKLNEQIEILLKQENISEDQRNILIRQMNKEPKKKETPQNNFRDFIKMKKKVA